MTNATSLTLETFCGTWKTMRDPDESGITRGAQIDIGTPSSRGGEIYANFQTTTSHADLFMEVIFGFSDDYRFGVTKLLFQDLRLSGDTLKPLKVYDIRDNVFFSDADVRMRIDPEDSNIMHVSIKTLPEHLNETFYSQVNRQLGHYLSVGKPLDLEERFYRVLDK